MSQFEILDLQKKRNWSHKDDYRRHDSQKDGSKEGYQPIDMNQLASAIWINGIRFKWDSIVGPAMAQQVTIESVQAPILTLVASNSMWMQEVIMRKGQILSSINHYYGDHIIKDIRVLMKKESFIKDEVQANNIDLSYQPKGKIDFSKISLPKEILDSIDASLETIKNPSLKAIGRKVQVQNWKKNKLLSKKGYVRCKLCGKWIEPQDGRKSPKGLICAQCHHGRYRAHVGQIIKILQDYPTLKYDQMKSYMRCTLAGFNQARKELIYYYMDKVHFGSNDPHHMYMLTQLITFKSVDQLEPQFVANLCAKYRSKFLPEGQAREKVEGNNRKN